MNENYMFVWNKHLTKFNERILQFYSFTFVNIYVDWKKHLQTFQHVNSALILSQTLPSFYFQRNLTWIFNWEVSFSEITRACHVDLSPKAV